MSHPIVSALLLALIFALELTSFSPADLVLAAVVGVGLVLALRGRLPAGPEGGTRASARRLAAVPAFAAAVIRDVVAGTWDVMLRVVHVRSVDHAGIVLVPIGDRSPQGVAVSALVMTLSPGTIFLDVDEERRAMLVHVVDASDPEEVRRRLQDFYDRFQAKVLP